MRARLESARETYLRQVENCDLYIGLFWLSYDPYTIEEYEHARVCEEPCLIYEKQIDMEKRDPLLKAFLGRVNRVGEGVTVCRFETPEELARRVQQDVQHVLVDCFRHQQRNKQQDDRSHTPPTSILINADHGSIAGYNVYRPTIHIHRQTDKE